MILIARHGQNTVGRVCDFKVEVGVFLELATPSFIVQDVFGGLRAREGKSIGSNANDIAVAFMESVYVEWIGSSQKLVRDGDV